jgi:hypothetical protein
VVIVRVNAAEERQSPWTDEIVEALDMIITRPVERLAATLRAGSL